MADIHNCIKCDDEFHMYNGTQCSVCGMWYCPNCDTKETEMLQSIEEDYYHICHNCLKEGLKYINEEHMDDAKFSKEEYDKTIKEIKS